MCRFDPCQRTCASRHHVARQQLVATALLLPRRPILDHHQETPETPAELLQALHGRQTVIRCAHQPRATIDECLDRALLWDTLRQWSTEHVALVARQPGRGPVVNLRDCFLATLG